MVPSHPFTMRSYRGFTLVEALLTMGVFLLILTVIGALLSFGVRQSLRQNSRSDAQRQLLIQSGNLSDKARLSAQSTVTLVRPTGPDNLYLSLAVPINSQGVLVRDPGGQPIFQSYWIWYHSQNVVGLFLTERVVSAPSIDPPPALSAAEVLAAVSARPGRKVVEVLSAFDADDLFAPTPLTQPQPGMLLRFGLVPPNAPPLQFTQSVRFVR